MATINFGGVPETVITRDEFPLAKALDLLKDEQDRIAVQLTRLQAQLVSSQENYDTARTNLVACLDLARELAQCPDWAVDLLNTGRMDWSPDSQEASAKEAASWTSAEACDAACKEKLEKLYAVVQAFPDERLGETIVLPFGPDGSDKNFTMEEIMGYPMWNFHYHLGQIGYIQSLYGDKGIH